MRPVLRGLCKYESLLGTDLDLCDITIMNEALDIEEENNLRAVAHAGASRGR